MDNSGRKRERRKQERIEDELMKYPEFKIARKAENVAILEVETLDIPERASSDGSPTTEQLEEEPEEEAEVEDQKENCIATKEEAEVEDQGENCIATKEEALKLKKEEVLAAAEVLVQNVMGSWDGSHDPFHAYRVRSLSLSLASEEGLNPDSLYVVELAALLHDIDDHKYASRGPREFPTAEEFLLKYGVETETREAVLTIIRTMGFKEELSRSSNQTCGPELGIVQDADRLDAMGAIGIGRTFTYGGSRSNAMHDPAIRPRLKMTKDEYMKHTTEQTTINHFHEKLLKLKNLMKTEAGKKRAERRHKFMEDFLSQFHKEWDGEL